MINIKTKSLTAITLQKFKKNFWSVLFLGNCQYLFEPTSAFILDTNDSKPQVNNYNESFDVLRTSTTNQILKHNYYSLSLNQKCDQAEWAANKLKSSYVKSNDFDEPDFIEDPKVKTGSANWLNYA